jgi:hypothetical protein
MPTLRVLKVTPGRIVNGRFVANRSKRNPPRATDHPDKSSSYHPKGGTSTEVRSPTSTSTEVRSPTETSTSTSTDAYTAGNLTVTGGAGKGATTRVDVYQHKMPESDKGSQRPQRAPWDRVPKVHAASANRKRARNSRAGTKAKRKRFMEMLAEVKARKNSRRRK